jgi:hypothetical protein
MFSRVTEPEQLMPLSMLIVRVKLPHAIDYRMYFDEENTLPLKGRVSFICAAIMLFLWLVLPVALFTDRTITVTGLVLFLLFIIGLSTSVNLVFFKPIQRTIIFARSGLVKNYRILVRLRDGTDRFLVDENVVLFERVARIAMQTLSSLLTELHRESSISVFECRTDLYQTFFERSPQGKRAKRSPRKRHPHES